MTHQFGIFTLIIFTITAHYVSSQTLLHSDCAILDKVQVSKHVYNFTQLSKSDIKVFDSEAKETITLRLCSPLEQKCGGRAGYSICMTKDGAEVGIGKSPPILKNDEHTLYFNFTGDLCEPNKNYTVQIIMKCDYSMSNASTPILFPDRTDHCSLQMLWSTLFACVPPKTTNCSIERDNYRFDLSTLTSSSDNYAVDLDGQGKMKMLINVCHSIVHEHGAICSSKVGACLVNATDPKNVKYMNYGEPIDGIFIENDILKIKYTRGEMCKDGGQNLPEQYETTISFICDPEAMIDTEPKYSNESRPCDYKFTWKTAMACNKTFLEQYRTAKANRCSVVDPETKSKFNLHELIDRDFIVSSSNNMQYKFQVCGSTNAGGCTSGTGICNTKNSASAGKANNNLIWRQGGPYLNYTDGVECGNGQRRYTLIAFFCGAEGSASSPIIIKDEPCYLTIHWYTEAVCTKRIKCAQNQTNLVPLIRNSKNYVVNASGAEFYINICRPVVPTPDLACPHGSAVCRAVRNSKGQYSKETSLGFPNEKPVLDSDQNLILNYNRGSPCPESPETNLSSSFKFICDYKGDVGLPEYKSYSNCHYIFEWRTNIVCGEFVGKWSSPCTIKDPSHSLELDLSVLYPQKIPRLITTKGKNYSINICGGKEHCNGSAVCEGINEYGTFSYVSFDYRSKLIKLHYSNGTKCFNESYASKLSLICNTTAGIGDPVLDLDANCSSVFKWETVVACLGETHDVTSSHPLITTEKTSIVPLKDYTSIQTWIISCTIMLVVIVIGIWLYLRKPQRCAHLRSRISAITATKNHSRVQYSRVRTPTDITVRHVNTTEEARLLLETSDPCTDGRIDSDDELLGV